MQPRSLQQILSELDSTFQPQIDNVRQRQALIPGQMQAEEQGLQAKQTQAFDDILGGARRRGLGFAGIPLGEQAKYTATDFLPAMARLKQTGREQAMSLEDAILGIQERKNTLGQQLYQGDLDRAEARRQAEASNAAYSSMFNGGKAAPTNTPGTKAATIMQNPQSKSFAFTDASGKPISAAAYAQLTNTSFRSLLEKMASSGDNGAKTALGFVGDDFGYDPSKVNSQSLADLYNALVWGTGKQASPFNPGKSYNPLSNQGAQNTHNAIAGWFGNPSIPKFGSGGSVNAQLQAARAAGQVR